MKKLWIWCLILCLGFSLVSCDAGTESSTKEDTPVNPSECKHETVQGATCTAPGRCTACGRPVGSSLDHDYDPNLGKCTRCGKVDTLGNKEEGITRVVCVGDSITYGGYWKDNLCGGLNESYEVIGLGVSGATGFASGIDYDSTLEQNVNRGFVNQSEYKLSLRYRPDIVVIMLGTNDTKPVNSDRIKADGGVQFKQDMTDMIASYRALSSAPEIYLGLPCTIFRDPNKGSKINEGDLVDLIIPLLREVAQECGVTLIDVHDATKDASAEFSDGVHPSTEAGKQIIASTVADAIKAGNNQNQSE